MPRFIHVPLLVVCLVLCAGIARGQHILKLADGRILQGEFVSATRTTVSFKVVGDAQSTRFQISDVLSVVFSTASPRAARQRKEPVTVPAGRVISVQISEEMSTKTSTAGQKFFATLVEDFVYSGETLAPAGKRVTGRVRKIVRPKRSIDKASIEVTLIDVTVEGRTIPVITDWAGIVNDGKGNVNTIGPAVVTNAVIGELQDGKHVRFPAGARVEFRLAQPMTIRPPLN